MEDYDLLFLCSTLQMSYKIPWFSLILSGATHGHYSSSLKKILKRTPLSKRNPFALFSTFSFSVMYTKARILAQIALVAWHEWLKQLFNFPTALSGSLSRRALSASLAARVETLKPTPVPFH